MSSTALAAQEKKQKLDAEAAAKTAKRRAKRLKEKARAAACLQRVPASCPGQAKAPCRLLI